jgi:hypothetical protein
MIEMQGPGVFLNPPNQPIYQETQVKLPENVVGVGQGIDWGAIGESVAKFGTELVSYDIEDKYKKKQRLLEDLEAKTQMSIDTASAYNDFDSVDAQITEYKNQVKEIVGYDIDSDGGGKTSSALLEQARKTAYSFDLYGQKARRETADDVMLSAFNDDSLAFQESLLNADDPAFELEGRLVQLTQMEQDAKAKEQKTMGDRAYLAAVRKEKIELLETKGKMQASSAKSFNEAREADKKQLEGRIANHNKELRSIWERTEQLAKETSALRAKPDKTEAEVAELRSLEIRMNSEAYQVQRLEAIAYKLQDSYAQEFYGRSWDEDIAKSMPEDTYSNILNAQNSRTNALNTASFLPYKRAEEAQRMQIASVTDRVNSAIRQAEADINLIDSVIKSASEADRPRFINARHARITTLEKDLLEINSGGVPLIVQDLTKTVDGLKFFGQSLKFDSSPTALTEFTANAVESYSQPHETIYKTFRNTVDKFNQFLSTRQDIPGSSITGDSREKRTKKNLASYSKLYQRIPDLNLNPSEINEVFLDVIQKNGVDPYQADGINIKPWSELSKEIQAAGIQLTPNGFLHTEIGVNAITELLRSNAPLDQWQNMLAFGSAGNEWFAVLNASHSESPMNGGVADMLAGALMNPDTRQAATAAFILFTPKDHIASNLDRIRNTGIAQQNPAGFTNAFETLKALATSHNGNGDPLKFIQGQTIDIEKLKEAQMLQKLSRNSNITDPMVGAQRTTGEKLSEETQDKVKLNAVMVELRDNVFPLIKAEVGPDVNLQDLLTGKNVSTALREISEIAIGHYYDAKYDTRTKYSDEDLWEITAERTNKSLQNFVVKSSGLQLEQPDTPEPPVGIADRFIAGSDIQYGLQDGGKQNLNVLLDADFDVNGLDKSTFNQYGTFTTPPADMENPSAVALAVSAVRGMDVSGIPGNASSNIMAIATEVIGGHKDNRTMLVAQAALKDLGNPKTLTEAIATAKRNMQRIQAGIDSGEFKFVVGTDISNLNKKQTATTVELRNKDNVLATFQPSPIKKSMLGSNAHRSALKRMSKEQFSKFAVGKINAGEVNHAMVVDYLTANGISNQSLRETTQWGNIIPWATPMSGLHIPMSIPNEDYTYEFVDHMGKSQWFVTKDGEPRQPVNGFLSTDDLKPYRTISKPQPKAPQQPKTSQQPKETYGKYVYTGAESRLSRRTGVTGIAGKPLLMYEWKGMGTPWQLDTARYGDDTSPTKVTLEPQEMEFETTLRNTLQAPMPFMKTWSEFIAPHMRPKREQVTSTKDASPAIQTFREWEKDQKLLGVTSETTEEPESRLGVRSDGLIDHKTVLTTVAGKPIVISYSKPTLSDNWVMEVVEPEVEESESTNGFMDFKRVSSVVKGVAASFIYAKPTSSKNWNLIQGPMVTDLGGEVIQSLQQGYVDGQLFGLRLPTRNQVVKAATEVNNAVEKYSMIAGEVWRQAQLANYIHPTNKHVRRQYVEAHEAYMRSLTLIAERNRIRNQPRETVKIFDDFVSREADNLVEISDNYVER